MLDGLSTPIPRREQLLARCARVAAGVTLVLAVSNWVGWATDNADLTRVFPSWPYMAPWSAAISAVLGVSILVQLGRPAPALVWTGRALATATGVIGAVFLAEYATGKSFGLDRWFFAGGVAATQAAWPGRPSTWTVLSVVALAVAVWLIRLNRRWARVVWPVCLAAAAVLPTVTALRYVFGALLLMDVTRATGQAIGSVVSLLLLNAATLMARPDRQPIAWLLARPDRWTLVRLVAILAGLPVAIGASRLLLLDVGLHPDAVWVLSITVGTVVIGMAVFFASQREQRLLIEKESLSSKRAEAEQERAQAQARYRLLLEAAPDALIIVETDGRISLANAQTDRMFGYPRQELVGRGVETLLPKRFRDKHVRHRLDFFADPAVRSMGVGMELWGLRRDGTEFPVAISLSPLHTAQSLQVLAAIRDVTERREYEQRLRRQHDELIETHRQLERLARFDTLTGLVNRAEAIARLETALTCSRDPGDHLGVLFCDVDHFKAINDTHGHVVGDLVLRALAERICQCVRHGDTVGRTGGDEILVLLPGLHGLEDAARIAEKIRSCAAEPIHQSGKTFQATLSIGATLAIPGEAVVTTSARADSAMYQAKHQGGNAVRTI